MDEIYNEDTEIDMLMRALDSKAQSPLCARRCVMKNTRGKLLHNLG